VAQSVEHASPDFSSGHNLRVLAGIKPLGQALPLGHALRLAGNLLMESLSLSLCPSPALTRALR